MKVECKGIESGSLFKYCFIAIFIFPIILGIISSIGNYVFTDSQPAIEHLSDINIQIPNIEKYKKEIENSTGIVSLIYSLIALIFLSAVISAFTWVFLWVGQFIYSYLYTYQLNITNYGLSFFSALKYSISSIFLSYVALAIITWFLDTYWLYQHSITPEPSTSTFNGEPIGPIFSLFLIGVLGICTGGVLGVALFIGGRVFSIYKPINLKVIPLKVIDDNKSHA